MPTPENPRKGDQMHFDQALRTHQQLEVGTVDRVAILERDLSTQVTDPTIMLLSRR